MSRILIMRTNIKRHQLHQVGATLEAHPAVMDWFVDFEDCDRVLRVEADEKFQENQLIRLLETDSIWCEDLDEGVVICN